MHIRIILTFFEKYKCPSIDFFLQSSRHASNEQLCLKHLDCMMIFDLACFPFPISYSVFPFRRRQWHPTPVLLPGKSHGQRSLEGCSPWGRWGSDMTKRLHFPFSLSRIREGNGNPLQCSCLENPRDGGAWWAGVYGVAQSRTWLMWLSSSSSSSIALGSDASVSVDTQSCLTFVTPWTVAC